MKKCISIYSFPFSQRLFTRTLKPTRIILLFTWGLGDQASSPNLDEMSKALEISVQQIFMKVWVSLTTVQFFNEKLSVPNLTGKKFKVYRSCMNSHWVSFYGPDIWGLLTHYKGLTITHLPRVHLFLICRGLPHDLSFPRPSRMGGISQITRLTSCGDLGAGHKNQQLSTFTWKELLKNILTWPLFSLQVCPCWCSTVYWGVF